MKINTDGKDRGIIYLQKEVHTANKWIYTARCGEVQVL